MTAPDLRIRTATASDLPALREVMDAAIAELQADFLSPAQIEASRAVMGLDTQLILDKTYFLALVDGAVAGCGGWSWRATLYGGDHSTALRNDAVLDPRRDAAKIRAMYTHPHFKRRGVGAAILNACEAAAKAGGFLRAELMATLAGEPLYRARGFQEVERVTADVGGVPVPLIRMAKDLC